MKSSPDFQEDMWSGGIQRLEESNNWKPSVMGKKRFDSVAVGGTGEEKVGFFFLIFFSFLIDELWT